MRKIVVLMLTILMALGFAGLASAHVKVQPAEVPAGSYQVFTVRVPSEKEAATTQVKVTIPDGVDVSRFEPKSDWSYETEKNADGKITSVTWKATGAGLGATEFGDFNMQGKVAADAKELVWKAYQTYSDGEVVEWTGAADADTPASVTKVTAAVTGDAHGYDHGAAAGATEEEDDGESDPLILSIAIAGLAISLVALGLALRKRK
ncbi:YcnI family protein [Cohnella yongneupensis]|uniref:YcnI family protein n=1 Tax=Cohnella yongneupensis TaxID=425006 RepID=A0ABW0QYB8_9BACL